MMSRAGASDTDGRVRILYLAQELDLSLLLGTDSDEERPQVCAEMDPIDAVGVVTDRAVDCVVTENRWYANDEGVPFVTAVKRVAPRVPVVVYAGDGPVTEEEQLRNAGADAFFWQTANPTKRSCIREEILDMAKQASTRRPDAARYNELERMLRLSDDAFAVHDFVNDRNVTYSGLKNLAPSDESTFTITDAFEMIYEGDRESVLEKNEAVLAKEPHAFDSLSDDFGTFSERVRVRKTDGSIAHCVMRGAAVFEGARLVKMYNSLTDVTPERELDWKLRSSEVLFESESDRAAAEEACQELVTHADCSAAWVTQSEGGESQSLLAAAGTHERFVTEGRTATCVVSLTEHTATATPELSPTGEPSTADDAEQKAGDPDKTEAWPCEHASGACAMRISEPETGYLAAAPIRRGGVTYGTLMIFRANPLTGAFERLLDSLATSLAFRHEVETHRRALRADSRVTMTVRLGADHVFGAVSAQDPLGSGARLRARELNRVDTETTRYIVSATAPDAGTDTVVDAFERTESVTDTAIIGSEDGACTLIVLVEGKSLKALLAPHACTVREIRVSDAAVTATIDAPPQTDVRMVVETIQDAYPDAVLGSRVRTDGDTLEQTGIDQLTAKQEEALRVAVVAGFFDRPQRVTGSDVADMLGVSRTTALHHIRNAEQRLFSDIL